MARRARSDQVPAALRVADDRPAADPVRQAARPAPRHRHALVNLSLQILREAAQRSAREPVGTIEVRLALHVLRPFVQEQQLLAEFWKAAPIEPHHPWTSCQLPYRWIALRLIEDGVCVEEANRP